MADVVDDGQDLVLPKSSDMFPENLRVLVFDEDRKYLLKLENHLREYKYQVTSCYEEERAMYLLRNHIDQFDIAIIEVKNPEGERFRLISEIGSEKNIPIIVMSKEKSNESVIKWMENGACDYLLKPLRRDAIPFLFKYLVKRRKQEKEKPSSVVSEEEKSEAEKSEAEKSEAEKSEAEKSEAEKSEAESTIRNPNKRKTESFLDHGSTSKKKGRVVWDEELTNKFLEAIEHLGPKKTVPKKILEVMGVPWLTRENVASHLQKFRQKVKEKEAIDQFDKGKNVQIQPCVQQKQEEEEEEATYETNNNLVPCVQQSINPNPIVTTTHDDGSLPMMTHPHDHNQNQTSYDFDEKIEGDIGYNIDNEYEVLMDNPSLFMQHTLLEALVGCCPFREEPVMAANTTSMVQNDQHLVYSTSSVEVTPTPQMMPTPYVSFPSHQNNTVEAMDGLCPFPQETVMANNTSMVQNDHHLVYSTSSLEVTPTPQMMPTPYGSFPGQNNIVEAMDGLCPFREEPVMAANTSMIQNDHHLVYSTSSLEVTPTPQMMPTPYVSFPPHQQEISMPMIGSENGGINNSYIVDDNNMGKKLIKKS